MNEQEPDWEIQRDRMVTEQLVTRGVRDVRVLDAMRAVPRHLFVPEEARKNAYADHPVPIGGGQTISQPYIVALMTELLHLRGDERVLEIGAGCGYQTAILSKLVGSVCALELDESLVRVAIANLGFCGVGNVDLRCGSGFVPWPGGGRFDAILCACAPEEVPGVLVGQLAPGGRLVIPVGPFKDVQMLYCLRLGEGGGLVEEYRTAVRFVAMRQSRSLS